MLEHCPPSHRLPCTWFLISDFRWCLITKFVLLRLLCHLIFCPVWEIHRRIYLQLHSITLTKRKKYICRICCYHKDAIAWHEKQIMPLCSKVKPTKPFRWFITFQPRAMIMKRDNIISDMSDSELALLHISHMLSIALSDLRLRPDIASVIILFLILSVSLHSNIEIQYSLNKGKHICICSNGSLYGSTMWHIFLFCAYNKRFECAFSYWGFVVVFVHGSV